MEELLKVIAVLIYGYLLGSVPLAYVIGKAVKGIDLRKVGSGTVGASNVWYNVGRKWIFPIGFFDVFVKGLTPISLARDGFNLGIEVQAATGILILLGHNWPLFLRFQGGRGVAPMVGIFLALARIELTVFIVIAVAGWRLTNNAALWVLISVFLLPLWSVLSGRPTAIVVLMAFAIVLTITKRLVSNSLRGTSNNILPLLWNRLVYDRDIREHDAWMRRGVSPEE